MLYFIMFVLGICLACVVIYTLTRQGQVKEVEKNQLRIISFQIQSLLLQEEMNEILSSIDSALHDYLSARISTSLRGEDD